MDSGTYTTVQNVVITCGTPGATIHYTTNGIDPTEADLEVAAGSSVLVDHSLTLKARAWKSGLDPSSVKSASYIIRSPIVAYVATDGSDSNSGLSWTLAKKTVQAGLDATASGDQVWVAAGTYVERIALKDGVGLYGGFAGTETDGSQRNRTVNVTVLDGSKGGSVVTAPSGTTASTVIDGFTIRNGEAQNGGGIYCIDSSPTISNNTIIANTASHGSNGGYGIGGGICCSGSSPTISSNTITANSADYGGGIYSNNTITANIGSGMSCSRSSSTISNNIVAFNSSGVYIGTGGTPTLRNNCIYNPGGYNYSGVPDPTGRNGNISADPKLVSAQYGKTHIRPDSPCLDAGDDTVVQTGWVDMDGQARIQGAHVDIGADESDGTNWTFTPAVVRVSPSGSDASDGSSWALAKRTVQAGLNAASADGGEVWVVAGTYNERISLLAYAYLYGGFNGTESSRNERNRTANTTVLDGGASGSVVTASSLGHATSAVDGFTIRNGAAQAGGGIYCYYSSPTISNNTITGNTASGYGLYGGGGICCYSSSPSISNNTITANNAGYDGGGIFCYDSSPAISSNAITANRAGSYGGGGVYCYGSSPTISNNTITANTTTGAYGGGIYCSGSSPTIASNTITANGATTYGGGIYCGSSAVISNNTIKANSASNGGGIYSWYSMPTISSNTITANSASNGGGIYCSGSSPTLSNNTTTANIARDGGGIYCSSSSPRISNDIVAFNSSGVYISTGDTPTLRNNCIYNPGSYNYSGLPDATGTDGNISADPKLVSAQYGKTHIQPDSPCLDAGDDTIVQTGWVDMDGQARIQGAHVDIGADESDGTISTFTPAVVRVSPSGDDANDGSSWALAKRTVQAGLNAASADGGEVWVVAGTYDERILLLAYACLYGGFNGTESSRNERNRTANTTVLDGGVSGSVVTASRLGHVTSAVDGFTIRNGAAQLGGGISCYYSSPTISNNTITANSASNGGGVCCSGSSPTISNNTITANTTTGAYGGGIYCDSSATICNNTITANSASNGGGIYCSSPATISNNIVALNASGIQAYNNPTLRNNCVYGNTGYDYSGVSAGVGDISVDPMLDDPVRGDFHLLQGSPCIDAGWNDAPGLTVVDVDGQPRVMGPAVDIGADELANWVLATYRVSPARYGCVGPVTLTIGGSGFRAGATAKLARAGGPELIPESVTFVSEWQLNARFNLLGAALGRYDVVMTNPDLQSAALPNGFEVTVGVGPKLGAKLNVPEQVRSGRDYVAWIEYGNDGDEDMPAPVFTVSSPTNTTMRLTQEEPFHTNPIQVLARIIRDEIERDTLCC